MRPIFSYYGGKQRMASKIVALIPKHTVYVEPFAGGASVFFKKPWPQVTNTHHYREVLNDTNSEIFNLYKCFQDKEKAEKLIHRLQFTLYSRQEHALRNDEAVDDIERAARFFCDVQKSFSNTLGGGWRTGVFGRNQAATWSKQVSRLTEYLDRMASVHIECMDALEVIEKWDSPQTFFYCDPPYPSAHQGHYSGYSVSDFGDLVKKLKTAKGSFMLSCYKQDGIPGDWEELEFDAFSTASGQGISGPNRDKSKKADRKSIGKRSRTELIWRRANSVPVREEIQKLYDSGKYDCFTG